MKAFGCEGSRPADEGYPGSRIGQGTPRIAKTHSGLISAFSLHLVKAGRVSVELGKALNKVEELRLVADYKGDPVDKEHAAWAVSQARTFVQAMQTTFMPKAPKKSSNGPEPF